MATRERTTNPTRAEGRYCVKCGQVFTTALDKRTECVKCRKVSDLECAKLINLSIEEVVELKRCSFNASLARTT